MGGCSVGVTISNPKIRIKDNDLLKSLQKAKATGVCGIIAVGMEMAKEQSIAESGYRLVFNVERGGGQVIFHLHLHLLGGWQLVFLETW